MTVLPLYSDSLSAEGVDVWHLCPSSIQRMLSYERELVGSAWDLLKSLGIPIHLFPPDAASLHPPPSSKNLPGPEAVDPYTTVCHFSLSTYDNLKKRALRSSLPKEGQGYDQVS